MKTRAEGISIKRICRQAGAIALMASCALPLCLPQAQARPSAGSAARSFAIAPGPLADALIQFGYQSGLQVAASGALTASARSPGVSGTLAPMAALSRLLSGTGLTFRITGQDTVQLEPAPQTAGSAIQLGAVEVEGMNGPSGGANGQSAAAHSSDPYAGQVTPPTTIASKMPVSQRETPQTVNVVSQMQIQRQNLVDLNDALRQTPGVVVAPYRDARSDLFSRGFPIDNIQIEGVPIDISTASNGPLSPGLAMYDRVEMLKGPAGLFNGFAGPGGTVNLVRKHPLDVFQVNADLGIGSYNDYRETLDVTGPVNTSHSVRVRLLESYQSTDLTQNTTYKRNLLIYGVAEADLSPSTLLRVGGSYQRLAQRSESQGLAAYDDYTLLRLPRSQYVGSPLNHDAYNSTTAFLELEQRLGSGWQLKLSTLYFGNRSTDIAGAYQSGAVERATGDFTYFSFSGQERIDQYAVDLHATGPLQLFGQTHQLVVGFNQQHTDDYLLDGLGAGLATANLAQDLAHLPAVPITTFYGGTTYADRYSLYANGRFRLIAPLTLILGGNLSWWRGIYDPDPANNPFGSTRTADSEKAKLTPYAALVLDLDRHHSLYGSYAKVFQPQTARTETNALVKPVDGEQFEAGLKGEYLDGKLNAALALFQITERNRAITDPLQPLSGFSVPQGKVRNRGIEVSLSGQITPDWTINTGYTYTEVKVLNAADDGATGNVDGWEPFTAIAPKHLFKLWTDYRLPGRWSKFSLGASLYATSSYSTVATSGTLVQPAYTTVGARISYRATDRVTLAVNATNLGNAYYYQSIGGVGGQNFIGDPRRILGTVHVTY
ncbi:TonB-dependent siderophore receptor [Novosphingobium terrae]|uniref:TonB-dependent siderophore receptor n=1 Tax=Novosphingobium terrae TaxID=2726189 RepID=UPI00197ECCA8|nr:TonB-dependent siderophore receptor [Novosphingobium terrae]